MNNNGDRNVIVISDELNVDLEGNNSNFIQCVVRDVFESENIFGGGTVTAPLIVAKTSKKSALPKLLRQRKKQSKSIKRKNSAVILSRLKKWN